MRCRHCGDHARWWRRVCRDCRHLWETWRRHRADGLPRLLDALAVTEVPRWRIERFLASEIGRDGATVGDWMAADTTNQLLGALGRRPSLAPGQVRLLRQRGAWKLYDRRPEWTTED